MTKKNYSQTISLRDTDGVKVTVFMQASKTGGLDIRAWMHTWVEDTAVMHTLLVAAASLARYEPFKERLSEIAQEHAEWLKQKGYATFGDGEALPSEDLPF